MQALRDEPGITAFAGCYERTVDVRTEEGTVGNVILDASADWKYVRDKAREADASAAQDYALDDYINLYPRADGLRRYGKVGDLPRLTPTDEEIVIDEKLSTLLGIREGDTVTLIGDDEEEYEAVVGGICENYVNHHIYMTSAYYKTVFGERPSNNLLLVKTPDASDVPEGSELDPKEVAKRVSAFKGVITYNRIAETRDHFHESLQSLDIVVWIIILAAAMLAFLVLFNLTNINVTERIRELATLKVLGFYDMETASYVYRENLLLTAIGLCLPREPAADGYRRLFGTVCRKLAPHVADRHHIHGLHDLRAGTAHEELCIRGDPHSRFFALRQLFLLLLHQKDQHGGVAQVRGVESYRGNALKFNPPGGL